MKRSLLPFKALLLLAGGLLVMPRLQAQVNLPQTWKFHTGDDPSWSEPGFNDAAWPSIHVGTNWENEGYPDYDGYAWYRTEVQLPSSLKTHSYLKGPLVISLGKIDDGDQLYLNGKLIGQNNDELGTIADGHYDENRSYEIPLDDPAIHWDGENTLAVRVLDHGGGGGMYEGPYQIRVSDVTDFVRLDDESQAFQFEGPRKVSKQLELSSSSAAYAFSGTLDIRIADPATGATVYHSSRQVHFSKAAPAKITYSATLPQSRSYTASYAFRDSRSGSSVEATEGVPYVLTPRPGPAPRITGARVVGVLPGHAFLFRVPATGLRPMRFAARGLPHGLSLDPQTGIIRGELSQAGDYLVHLEASNSKGHATDTLLIRVGSRIGLTPAMGWNSWNAWGLSVNDSKVRASAQAMVRKGLVDHGWTYINIDDGWERPTRTSTGEVVPNSKFPSMKALATYIHSLGLKMGIYSSPGPKTCGGFLGSYQHEVQDAHTYASWGIDYLKYDWCSYGEIAPKDPDLDWLQKPYRLMDSALKAQDRDIYFSLCQYGMGRVWTWGDQVGGNSWRTTGDIRDSWTSMSGIGFHQGAEAPYAGPGHWNDPDMLVVGKVGWGPSLHQSHLTPDEQYTHISLWCLLSAPLLIGCDMSQLDDFTLNLLTNDEVLALDQDPLGREATEVAAYGDVKVYEKPLADGNVAVGLFNVGSHPADAELQFSDLKLQGTQQLRDLWRQRDLGTFQTDYLARGIPSHGVLLLKLSRTR